MLLCGEYCFFWLRGKGAILLVVQSLAVDFFKRMDAGRTLSAGETSVCCAVHSGKLAGDSARQRFGRAV